MPSLRPSAVENWVGPREIANKLEGLSRKDQDFGLDLDFSVPYMKPFE